MISNTKKRVFHKRGKVWRQLTKLMVQSYLLNKRCDLLVLLVMKLKKRRQFKGAQRHWLTLACSWRVGVLNISSLAISWTNSPLISQFPHEVIRPLTMSALPVESVLLSQMFMQIARQLQFVHNTHAPGKPYYLKMIVPQNVGIKFKSCPV